ncbi:Transposase DDE domain-containing protein [Paractinoplanes atraurantiacus]|uniref:Transposase DDE domain-containing protein n=1 Tax=Paractinoplanes atraurantiacus TaxID=1036182 RepID=A0A285JPB1_9ACTN|nr:Transposase DDE domain-containing protein [Actinoplanes atraurantiacus]
MDRGKPGSKIHAVSDRNGLPLTVVVSAANVNDSTMLEDVLDNLHAIRQPLGRPRRWPAKLHGD